MDKKMVKRSNQASTKVLIQWLDGDANTATWEFLFDLQAKFSNCTLEDKGTSEGGVLMGGNDQRCMEMTI